VSKDLVTKIEALESKKDKSISLDMDIIQVLEKMGWYPHYTRINVARQFLSKEGKIRQTRIVNALCRIYAVGKIKTLDELKNRVEKAGCWGMKDLGPLSIQEFYRALNSYGVPSFKTSEKDIPYKDSF
jgi:hypothetical protein